MAGDGEDEAGPALASGLAAVEEGLETLRRIAATDEGAYAVPLLAQVGRWMDWSGGVETGGGELKGVLVCQVTELELALCSRNEELDNVKRELQVRGM